MDQESKDQATLVTGPAGLDPAPLPTERVLNAPVVARKSRSGNVLNIALGGALVLAVAGVGFATGRMTAPASTGLVGGQLPNGRPGGQVITGVDGKPGGPAGIISGGPTIEGTVESVTATTLTVKTASGETVQIALDDSTTYHAQSDASSDDVATGGKVLVRVNIRAPSGSGSVTNPSASDVTVVP